MRLGAMRFGVRMRRRRRVGRRYWTRRDARAPRAARWWRWSPRGFQRDLARRCTRVLDADLAGALMGIHAVKGVEVGAGFAAARMSGEEHNDAMRMRDGAPAFLSNNAGGVLGGVSTGQALVARIAVKPTSSIRAAQETITEDGENIDLSTTGRHDPCVGVRAPPVAEAMMACVLADHWLWAEALRAGSSVAGVNGGEPSVD